MSTIVFCNVGTRDVVVAGQEGQKPPPARTRGKTLLAQLEAAEPEITADHLKFPILQSGLDEILRAENGRIEHLILIGTDQDESITPQHNWLNDTTYYAQIAARVLVPRYQGQIAMVTTVAIGQKPEPFNPSLYNKAFAHYEAILRPYLSDVVSCYYVMPVGGIPACNTALILQGVRLFDVRCRTLFVTENGRPYHLDVADQLLGMMRENTAIDLLRRLDFTAAQPLLTTGRAFDDPVPHLIQYASARLWFDFVAAQRHLDLALRFSQAMLIGHEQLRAEQRALNQLLAGEELLLISELYYNALIAWENGRFVDFLGRATRFQEAVLLYVAQQRAPHLLQLVTPSEVAIDARKREYLQRQLEQALLRQPGVNLAAQHQPLSPLRQKMGELFSLGEIKTLCLFLEIEYEELSGDTRSEKVIGVIDFVLRHERLDDLVTILDRERPFVAWHTLMMAQESEPDPLPVVLAVLARLERLVVIRQQSIIAHGYQGASDDIIRQAYNTPPVAEQYSPIQDMFEVCRALNAPATNPLLRVRDFLIHLLRGVYV
jgi:hypothetical protein